MIRLAFMLGAFLTVGIIAGVMLLWNRPKKKTQTKTTNKNEPVSKT
jgi:hypothetical protein